ncbi:MAG: c-type cytochrome biogenesis protein CcmF [Porticoccaceae bacterium]|nr:MAG: c-type cytochrome biogenesis protein CcmF [Porticoccaceae bacterium]
MIPELGHFALAVGLALALAAGVLALWGAARGELLWMAAARPLAGAQFAFTAFAFCCLAGAFLSDDFSVAYVAANSNSALPWYYKLSAVWGAHEGSLLLWLLILDGWLLAVAVAPARSLVEQARVLGVLSLVAVGFHLFLLLTSNPFARLLPLPAADGADLNPLLQDIGLILHPPMLYMGYVGFGVPFAFAIAALLAGGCDAAWARAARRWAGLAWVFLTLGIALGSWWAYYELGWGGWWFWDPVENASFMPWLVGTALVHSLAVTENRGLFRSWTLLLAIFTFALSLLGTFLVRSGVLTSVHAFAADPARGAFVLAFLVLVVGASLVLYGLRAGSLRGEASFGFLSREWFLLANNLLLTVAAATILLGTLYPLLAEAAGWGRISVGPPYFNFFFVPLALATVFLMAPGGLARWKKTSWDWLRPRLSLPALAALAGGVALPWWWGGRPAPAALAATAGFLWVAFAIGRDLWEKSAHSQGRLAGLRRLRRGYWGMQLAHLGVACALLGAGAVSSFGVERDVRMAPGEAVEVAGYSFRFQGVRGIEGPNFHGVAGELEVARDGRPVARLEPEKRRYPVRGQVMTEAAIDPGLWRDLYVSLGEELEGGAWALRIQVKPLVRWIWGGALLAAVGMVLALSERRARARTAARMERSAREALSGAGR